MPNAQFGELADAAGRRVLVAFAAGLRVVNRPEPIRNTLHLVELGLVCLMGGLIHHAVAGAVESRWCLVRTRRGRSKQDNYQRESQNDALHFLPSLCSRDGQGGSLRVACGARGRLRGLGITELNRTLLATGRIRPQTVLEKTGDDL